MQLLLLISILMWSGCTYSTNPIFTEQDNVFDGSFVGTWEVVKDADWPDFPRSFEVTRWGPDEESYRVIIRNPSDGKQGAFQLYLSQIDGRRFLTGKFEKPGSEKAAPDKPADPASYITFAIDPLEGGQLKMRYLRGDWLAGQLKSNPEVVKHEWNARPGNPEKQVLLLTASTAELRAFVLSQLDKRDAWMPITFQVIR